MSHTTTFEAAPCEAPEKIRITSKFGMLIFLLSESMLFAGFIAGYIVLRYALPQWPPSDLPVEQNFRIFWPPTLINIIMILNTIILVSSSFTFHLAEVRVKQDKSATPALLLSVLLGVIFLSLQAFEWLHLIDGGLVFASKDVFGCSFFALTGFHGLHVLGGVVMMLFCVRRSLKGTFTKSQHTFLENTGLYWHFVDVIWVLLFTILYIV